MRTTSTALAFVFAFAATTAVADVQQAMEGCNLFTLQVTDNRNEAILDGTTENTCFPALDEDATLAMFLDGEMVAKASMDEADRTQAVHVQRSPGKAGDHEVCLMLTGTATKIVDGATQEFEDMVCFTAVF